VGANINRLFGIVFRHALGARQVGPWCGRAGSCGDAATPRPRLLSLIPE
jgi:hypothetical protein